MRIENKGPRDTGDKCPVSGNLAAKRDSPNRVGKRRIAKREMLLKLIKNVFIALAIVAGLIVLWETYLYVTQSPATATADAEGEFRRRCADRGLKPSDFVGPVYKEEKSGAYSFLWTQKNKNAEILVSVQYGPHVTDSWYIDQSNR